MANPIEEFQLWEKSNQTMENISLEANPTMKSTNFSHSSAMANDSGLASLTCLARTWQQVNFRVGDVLICESEMMMMMMT